MYQVSERVKKQFEYTMSIPCVKEAMKFIQEDERNTIEEQKELVLIEAPTGEDRGSSGYSLSIWNGTWCRGERRIPLRTGNR